jgi:uncharacterized protein YdhG (YjbR/CyaY superfamily)
MKVPASSVGEYLAALPPERRATLSVLRQLILKNLPPGYVEAFQCGMICYVIPLDRFPHTYNGHPLVIVSFGAQKHHLALYLMCIYGDSHHRRWFESEFQKAGKTLDAGKACVRFRSLDDLPLDLIRRAVSRVSVERLIAWHNAAQSQRPHRRPAKSGSRRATKASAAIAP